MKAWNFLYELQQVNLIKLILKHRKKVINILLFSHKN